MRVVKLLIASVVLLAAFYFPSIAFAEEDCGDTYTVVRGDTLGKIAKRCGTTWSFIALANPQIKNPNRIFPGQELKIPEEEDLEEIGNSDDTAEAIEQVKDIVDLEGGERWIDVDISQQRVYAYEGTEMVQSFLVSTGRYRTPTVLGQYEIWIKFRYDDMSGPGYFLEDVPYVMYFHKGYGLHGTYWHDNFGTPMSRGCVNLSEEDAAWLYDFASVGTLVSVHP